MSEALRKWPHTSLQEQREGALRSWSSLCLLGCRCLSEAISSYTERWQQVPWLLSDRLPLRNWTGKGDSREFSPQQTFSQISLAEVHLALLVVTCHTWALCYTPGIKTKVPATETAHLTYRDINTQRLHCRL